MTEKKINNSWDEVVNALLTIFNMIYIPFIFFSLIWSFGTARELGDYIITFIVSLMNLVVLIIYLKITKAYNGKFFYIIVAIWFLLELFIFYMALYYYFIYGPDVHYRITESIYDEEEFANAEADGYLVLIGIMICQTIKVFLITKEPIKYLTRKYLEIRAKLLKIK